MTSLKTRKLGKHREQNDATQFSKPKMDYTMYVVSLITVSKRLLHTLITKCDKVTVGWPVFIIKLLNYIEMFDDTDPRKCMTECPELNLKNEFSFFLCLLMIILTIALVEF